ncbi:hypothetical protein GA0115253_105336 [Streptomyces sp. Termitarium-T10T-6]|nr:hypothetical protein GA0115253_105336 [Streptomyces sp. Termitarium-T10T-6]
MGEGPVRVGKQRVLAPCGHPTVEALRVLLTGGAALHKRGSQPKAPEQLGQHELFGDIAYDKRDAQLAVIGPYGDQRHERRLPGPDHADQMSQLIERKRLGLRELHPAGCTGIELQSLQPMRPVARCESASALLLIHPLGSGCEFGERNLNRVGRPRSPGAEIVSWCRFKHKLRRHRDGGIPAPVHEPVGTLLSLRKRVRGELGQAAEHGVVNGETVGSHGRDHPAGRSTARRNSIGPQSLRQLQVRLQALLPHPPPPHRPQQVARRGQRQAVVGAGDEPGGLGEGIPAEEYPYSGGVAPRLKVLKEAQSQFDLAERRGLRRGVLLGPGSQIAGKLLVPAAAVTHPSLRSFP